MIELLRCTVSSIATEFKLYLPDIIPHMLKVFITDKSERRTIIQQVYFPRSFSITEERNFLAYRK